jgi:hypothetical protein
MEALAKADPPPSSTDLAAWQEVVANGRLGEFSMEAIVAAFLDLRPNTERNIRHDLVRHISDDMYSRLRRNTGRNHPNEGKDIIDRVHFQLWEALARPRSKDAQGMRVAYGSRVMFRMKDAIAKEALAQRVPDEAVASKKKKAKKQKQENDVSDEVKLVDLSKHPDLTDEDQSDDNDVVGGAGIQRDPGLLDGVHDTDETLDVDRFLEANVPDYKKRLAFRLYMDRVPYKSTRGDSIEKTVGIDESTARKWIKEVQEQLKQKIGEQS